MATATRKGLFCVADVNFETTQLVHKIWVNYDETFTTALIIKATQFWEKNVFPKLYESLKE